MKANDVEQYLANLKADIGRLTLGWPRDGRAAGRDGATAYPTLAATFEALEQYGGLGYPSGGWSGVRGGSDSTMPERVVVAGEKRDKQGNHVGWRESDDHAAALLDMTTALRMAAELVHDLVVGVARHAPLSVEQVRPPETATCKKCNRTIAANAVDPCLAGYCTSSKDRPDGGCHADWQDDQREKTRLRVARHRAGLRDAALAEDVTLT